MRTHNTLQSCLCLGAWLLGPIVGAQSCRAAEIVLPETGIDQRIDFQQYRFGLAPAEFDYDATGPHGPVLSAGRPMWRTYVDLYAPSPKIVLIQSSALAKADHYPVALLQGVTSTNLKLSVCFKLLAGHTARSAGLLWRAQDKDNYCAVLASGLDQTVCLLSIKQGRPVELATARAAVAQKEWNTLEVSAHGDRFLIWLNDQRILETRDPTLAQAGRVGLLTHADTIAIFDDFHVQSGEGRIVRKN